MKLKNKLIIGAALGLLIGVIYNLLFYFLLSSNFDFNLGIIKWPIIVIMFIIAIPFFITTLIFSLFGVNTMGYLFYGMIASLPVYIAVGLLIAYSHHKIWK
jgi:hypothetical protein